VVVISRYCSSKFRCMEKPALEDSLRRMVLFWHIYGPHGRTGAGSLPTKYGKDGQHVESPGCSISCEVTVPRRDPRTER
jgi:hypothetical protein